MPIVDDVKRIFEGYPPHEFEPSDCLRRLINLFDTACVPGGECDPRNLDKARNACNSYGYASNLFLLNQYPAAAESILLNAWTKFEDIQRAERQRIYRAGIGMYLARMYLKGGDKGAACRWGLLTQADDILGEHSTGEGAGRQLLHTVLGMSDKAIAEFNDIALQNLLRVKQEAGNDWSVAYSFPEDVVVRFALNCQAWAYLIALPSSVYEFPLSKTYLLALFDNLNDPDLKAKEKGDCLEDIASYLFLLIPGWVPRRNLLEEKLSFETDVLIRNLTQSSNLTSDLLGRHFLAECKNWDKPVGVRDIGYFLYRMRLTHAKFGVIFAKRGITGNRSEEKAAFSLIRKAFHEDGSVCVVLDNNDLISLINEDLSFWSVLLERIEGMRFGEAK